MEIFVYKGEYGLPSVELDCLRVLVMKITHVILNLYKFSKIYIMLKN